MQFRVSAMQSDGSVVQFAICLARPQQTRPGQGTPEQTYVEGFNRIPTDGSFAVLASQLATFTKYLNDVFLSY